MPFIHLHVHSEYSLVDGLVRINELVDNAYELNMPAVALTDHSNLYAMVKFYSKAMAKGIKPIIGSEVWVDNDIHPEQPMRLLLLCQNEQGYGNLTRLISKAHIQGKSHGQAIIQKSWLTKNASDGLIAIAVMHDSDICQALLQANDDLAETLVEYWTGIFPNRFYCEIARLGKPNELMLIQGLVKLSESKSCPLVATNNVRFLKNEDFEAHEARVCIHEGAKLSDKNRSKHYTDQQYLKSTSEMKALFADIPESIENAYEIAKRCNLNLTLGKVFLPDFPVPAGKTIETFLVDVAKEGLEKRLEQLGADIRGEEHDYHHRLAIELEVINKMGFAGYFLIVADFIRWAKENDIPVGPGRGSGAGSLVAYALSITDLDPIKYDLLFERFLNPERVSMPDFDIDFCMDGRDRVIEYVAKRYGRESVSQIITYGTMAAKAVIRDVGRVLGHPYGFVDKLAKLIPMELGITLTKALKDEEALKARYDEDDDVKALLDLAMKLEGITRNVGKHAGGVVIAPSKLTDFTPLYCEDNDSGIVTQFDKNDVESIGLVKFDFLGLRTLTIIDWAVKTENEKRQTEGQDPVDIASISLKDPKTFELLCQCNTTAVFQLESRGMKDLIRRLQPDSFEDIVALVALFRPGPLQSGMVDDFINRKLGKASIEYPHPDLESILKPTYGIILYQEQVMQIAQVLAKYTLGAADLLRRAMGKKKPEEMAKQREIFTKGAVERGVKKETATYIFDLMEKFAGYGFNKSHSAAYAMVTYQTAWLKTHCPASFMAAVLSSDMAHTDKVVILIEDARKQKLSVLSPDINAGYFRFSVNADNDILYGLGAIKGVGEAAIESIVRAREEQGQYKDIYDLCARIDLKKASRRVLEALIKAGALDKLGSHRAFLMANLEPAIAAAEQWHKNAKEGQNDLFGSSIKADDLLEQPKVANIAPWKADQRLQGEKDTLGLYLTGHPIDEYQKELRAIGQVPIVALSPQPKKSQWLAGFIINIRTLQTKRGDRMAFVTLDDKTGRQEVAIFSDLYREKKDSLQKDQLILVEAEISHDDYSGGLRARSKSILTLDEARNTRAQNLNVKVDAKKISQQFTDELKAAISHHLQGECPVQIEYRKNNIQAKLHFGEHWLIAPNTVLLEKLSEISGVESVEVSY